MGIEFEWDPAKASANQAKHGIGFVEAATAFGDRRSLTIADPDHSTVEARKLLLGTTEGGTLIVVAFTERGARLRLISARPASRKERRTYGTS